MPENSVHRYCGNCGAEISSGISFCTFCGRPVNGKLTGSGTTPKRMNELLIKYPNPENRNTRAQNDGGCLTGVLLGVLLIFAAISIFLIFALVAASIGGKGASIYSFMTVLGLFAFFGAIFYIGWNLDKFF